VIFRPYLQLINFLPGERGSTNGQVLKRIDVSKYVELSCLPGEEGGHIPGYQPLGGFKRRNIEVNEEEFLSKNLLIIILVGIFWGCSTYNNTAGRKFDTTAINRIEVGKTTESEVIAMLGRPGSESNLDNGIVIYYYNYGYKEGLGGSSVDSLQIQLFKGVVINKSQRLSRYH
jgi:hypothetical protein